MSTLYLVRHGQASAGTHDYDRLSATGRKQAQLLGQWWAKQQFSPNHAFHGTMTRQRDTANLSLTAIDKHNNAVVDAGLDEYAHRIVEPLFSEQTDDFQQESMSFEQYQGVLQRWRDASADTCGDKVETWQNFHRRGWETIKRLNQDADKHDELVFFTSGGIIATVVSCVLNLDFEHTVDAIWRIRNSSITTLHVDKEQVRMVDFNTVPHLHYTNNESLITLI